RGGATFARYCAIACGVLNDGDSSAEPASLSAWLIADSATVEPTAPFLLFFRALAHCTQTLLDLLSPGAYRNHMGVLCSAAAEYSRPETLTPRPPRVELMLSQTVPETLRPSALPWSGTGTLRPNSSTLGTTGRQCQAALSHSAPSVAPSRAPIR